ncbi:YSIRK-type signal peptide-containing protein [Lactobacillus sp. R2/2]|nr:YSIRK-type signal peptide-containing protein [Lactobacillus sp. R2/2]
MAMQAKQDHFSIRKLSIGAASVLLGFTYLGLSSKAVSADTVIPPQQISKKSRVTAKIDAQATPTPTPTPRDNAAQNSTTATNNMTKPQSQKANQI